MPPYHNGSQRSHRTFHIVPWQSHHTFKTLILHVQQIHPSIPEPQFPIAIAFLPEASNMFISLTTRIFTSKKKTAQLDVTSFRRTNSRPPAVHGEDLPHLNGQVIEQMGSQSIRRKISGNTDLLFFFKC